MADSPGSLASGAAGWREKWRQLNFDGHGFIDGASVAALSGKTYVDSTPVDGSALCEVAEFQREDIDRAVSSAVKCWQEGRWRNETPKARKAVLRRLAELIMTHRDELALLETLDTGRPIGDSLAVDVNYAAQCFEWYAEIVDKRYDEAILPSRQDMVTIIREPLGVIGAIVPWNYPILMASWKLAPALALGNSVVLKPDEKSPLTAILMARLALEAGLPPGALNVCPGYGVPAGEALGLHPDVDCVSFTGSVEVGKLLQQYAGMSNMKRIFAETGGKGPNIVFDDVNDLDAVASAVGWGAYYNQGESCSAGTRLLVQDTIHDELTARVATFAKSFPLGDPLDPSTSMGALISEEHLARVHGYTEAAISAGAEVMTGGTRASVIENGTYYQPTVVDKVSRGDRIFAEEVFGPVLAVTIFSDREEAVSLANDTRYGLAGAVWSSNIDTAMSVARDVRAGVMWVNAYDLSDFSVPFGGFGQSGYGRAKSHHALDKYSDLKSLWVRLG